MKVFQTEQKNLTLFFGKKDQHLRMKFIKHIFFRLRPITPDEPEIPDELGGSQR